MSAPAEALRRHRKLSADIKLRVPRDLREDLERIAEKAGCSLSDISREALADYAKAHRVPAKKPAAR